MAFWAFLYRCRVGDHVFKLSDLVVSNVDVSKFAAAHDEGYLYHVAVLKELACLCSLYLEVVSVGANAETQSLNLSLLCRLLLLLLLLFLTVEELTKVEDFADGRAGVWSYFNEVEFALFSQG